MGSQLVYGTKNFSLETDPLLACSCGHLKCDKRVVSLDTLEILQYMRDIRGKPMRVTSGGRCPYHPAEQGRTDTDHQLGIGVDIACTGDVERMELNKLAVAVDVDALGVYDNHVHLAWRDELPGVLWLGKSK